MTTHEKGAETVLLGERWVGIKERISIGTQFVRTKEFVHSRTVVSAVNGSRLISETNVAVGVATVNSRTMENNLIRGNEIFFFFTFSSLISTFFRLFLASISYVI